jgi:hypothetical protein
LIGYEGWIKLCDDDLDGNFAIVVERSFGKAQADRVRSGLWPEQRGDRARHEQVAAS